MEADAPGKKGPKTLPGRPCKPNLDRVRRKPGGTILLGDHRTQHCAGRSVRILDWDIDQHWFAMLYGRRRPFDQKMVELIFQLVVLFAYFSRDIIGRLLVEKL